MDALVEVHSEEDLEKALQCGASTIGVNNRDLGTMSVSLDTSMRLVASIPDDITKISESGIETAADIARLRSAGFDAFLVGECLMRADDPGTALRALLGAGDG